MAESFFKKLLDKSSPEMEAHAATPMDFPHGEVEDAPLQGKRAMLNTDQLAAYTAIGRFIDGDRDLDSDMDDGVSALLIEGFAGTGKSFLLGAVAEMLAPRLDLKVCFAAPTHPAVKVVRGMVGGVQPLEDANAMTQKVVSGFNFMTLAALMRLKEVINDDTGEVTFEAPLNTDPAPAESMDVIFLDEGSMVAKRYLSGLIEMAERKGIALILLGDGAQLFPVGERKSPLFRSAWRKKNNVHRIALTIPVRQKGGSPILDLATAIREDRWDGSMAGWKVLRGTSALVKWALENKPESPSDWRVVAYRNVVVDDVNRRVRAALFPSYPEGVPQEGEHLITCSPVVRDRMIVLTNGTPLQILFSSVVETGVHKADGSPVGLKSVRIMAVDDTNKRHQLTLLHPDSIEEYNELMGEWVVHCRKHREKREWGKYYEIERSFLKWQFPYASTAHKAQGCTVGKVILMMDDLSRMERHDPVNYLCILYVGVTRSKEEVIFVKG